MAINLNEVKLKQKALAWSPSESKLKTKSNGYQQSEKTDLINRLAISKKNHRLADFMFDKSERKGHFCICT